MTVPKGFEPLHLKDAFEGLIVYVDEGMECLEPGLAFVQYDSKFGCYIDCDEGAHYLDGHLADEEDPNDDRLIGFYADPLHIEARKVSYGYAVFYDNGATSIAARYYYRADAIKYIKNIIRNSGGKIRPDLFIIKQESIKEGELDIE